MRPIRPSRKAGMPSRGCAHPPVETNDLDAAIRTLGEELADDQSNHSSAVFQVAVVGAPQELSPRLRDEVYGIAAEALRNAFRHAEARQIEVEIRYDEYVADGAGRCWSPRHRLSQHGRVLLFSWIWVTGSYPRGELASCSATCAIWLAVLQRYPYGGHMRLSLHLMPILCILAGLGAAEVLKRLGRNRGDGLVIWTSGSVRSSGDGLGGPSYERGVLVAPLSRLTAIVLVCLFTLAAVFAARDFYLPGKEPSDIRKRDFAAWFWSGLKRAGTRSSAWRRTCRRHPLAGQIGPRPPCPAVSLQRANLLAAAYPGQAVRPGPRLARTSAGLRAVLVAPGVLRSGRTQSLAGCDAQPL